MIKTIFENSLRSEKVLDAYFRPKNFERDGSVYKKLGVKSVQTVVMGTIGRLFRALGGDAHSGIYFIGRKLSEASLRNYEFGTRVNETVHLLGFFYCIRLVAK